MFFRCCSWSFTGGLLLGVVFLLPAVGQDKKLPPSSLPIYRIGPPDVLLIQLGKGWHGPPVDGRFRVAPDGTITLGTLGLVRVSGLTVPEARKVVAELLHAKVDPKAITLEQVLGGVHIEVALFASNVYYVIVENHKSKDRMLSFPATGKDTILDAMARVGKMERVLWRKMQLVRPAPDGSGRAKVLEVEWQAILRGQSLKTNFQLQPGDILVVACEGPEK